MEPSVAKMAWKWRRYPRKQHLKENKQDHKNEDGPKNKDIPGDGDEAKIWITDNQSIGAKRSSSNINLNFPTGKGFGKISFLEIT